MQPDKLQPFRDEWQDPGFAAQWDMRPTNTNPVRGEQLDILVSIIAGNFIAGDAILDLGMGSGQVEELIFQRIPGAQIVGVDSSRAMLDIALDRLAPYSGQLTVIEHDLGEAGSPPLPRSEFRFIIASQVLHEIPHEAKRSAFRLVREALADDGMFLIADRSTLDPDYFHDAYGPMWRRWKAGAPELVGGTFEEFFQQYRAKVDHTATVGQHMQWLEEAGFAATAIHVHLNRFVLAAQPARR